MVLAVIGALLYKSTRIMKIHAAAAAAVYDDDNIK